MSHPHPAFILFIVAFVVALTRGRLRQTVLVVGTGLTLAALFQLDTDTVYTT